VSKKLIVLSLAVGVSLLACLGCGADLPIPSQKGDSQSPAADQAPGADVAQMDASQAPANVDALRAAPEWQQQLTEAFEAAANAHDIPVDLLVTLAKVGSGFENRGNTPTVEGGYGIMALRKNDLGGDSLALAAELTGESTDVLIADPTANIMGAAAVLSAYAKEADVDTSEGIEAWLPAVIKYAGLDEDNSKFFARGVYELIQIGFSTYNSYGEEFMVPPYDLAMDLNSLVPPGMKQIPLEVLEEGVDPDKWLKQQELKEVDYPNAIWDPAASCNYSTYIESKDTIVVHTIEGTAAGARSWMKNCASSVSSHYVISEAGTVPSMV